MKERKVQRKKVPITNVILIAIYTFYALINT